MSVFFGVRIPDEMAAMIEATGKGKSAVIMAALEAYFGGKEAMPAKAEKMIIERDPEPAKPRTSKKTKPIKNEPVITRAMFRGQGKCPHNYMNWLICPECRG